jgi:hypothetical protein
VLEKGEQNEKSDGACKSAGCVRKRVPFATTLGSDSLTLNYKKVVGSTNSIDWFTDVSATSSITSATFSSEETVSAYLRVTNNYTDASPSVLAVFPK